MALLRRPSVPVRRALSRCHPRTVQTGSPSTSTTTTPSLMPGCCWPPPSPTGWGSSRWSMSWSTWVIAHRRWGRSHAPSPSAHPPARPGRRDRLGSGVGSRCRTRPGADDHRCGLHHLRSPWPSEGRRRLRLHPTARLPPAAGHPGRHGEMLHIRMRKGSANSARGPSGSSTSWLAGYGGPARLGSLPCGPARASGPPRS
jgi:hypothetical protein